MRAGLAGMFLLAIPSDFAHSQVAEAAAVIGALSSIASHFGPKSGGNTQILLAIANNIQVLNTSLQHVTRELDNLKTDVRDIPDRVLQHEMTVQITGRLQNTYETIGILENSSRIPERISIYRDLRRYYDAARDVRSDLFSGEMAVAERLTLHIPLLYGIELASFNTLNSIDLEDSANSANWAYHVHEAHWVSALRQYERFYRFSLDPGRVGSFASRLADAERSITAIFSRLPTDLQHQIAESDQVILTTALCYFTVVEEKVGGYRICDDSGCTNEYEINHVYSFYRQSFVFKRDDDGVISEARKWSEFLGDYDTLNFGHPIPDFMSDHGRDCDRLVSPSEVTASHALESDDIKNLELLFAERNLLRELIKIGEVMEAQIVDEKRLRGLLDESQSPVNSLRRRPVFLGTHTLQ